MVRILRTLPFRQGSGGLGGLLVQAEEYTRMCILWEPRGEGRVKIPCVEMSSHRPRLRIAILLE